MSKSKKKTKKQNISDPLLAPDYPTAISPEFVPSLNPDITDTTAYDSTDVFDFIPELKGNKFS